MKQAKFSELVKKQCRSVALEYLLNIKESHSKMDNLKYSELKLQSLYKSKQVYSTTAKNIFKWRTRMFELKNNFKTKYSNFSCPLCFKHLDDDESLLTCEILNSPKSENINLNYKDLFKQDVEKMLSIGKSLQEAWTVRNVLLSDNLS